MGRGRGPQQQEAIVGVTSGRGLNWGRQTKSPHEGPDRRKTLIGPSKEPTNALHRRAHIWMPAIHWEQMVCWCQIEIVELWLPTERITSSQQAV